MERTPFLSRLRRGLPIVVVSGLPRSGTSMAMRMLEAGGMPIVTDGLRAADVSNPNGYYEYERVKDLDKPGDTDWLAEARGKAIKIISYLVTHLPASYDYKVVFMRRDLGEVVSSQNKMLDARRETRGLEAEPSRVLYGRHLEQVERFLRQRRCFETLMVDYAAVLEDPRSEAARIAQFLGGRLDIDRMAGVVQPDLRRNRRDSSG